MKEPLPAHPAELGGEMNIFEKGNWNKDLICPICKTGKEGKVVLIPIYGTQKGNICEAQQIHFDCLDFTYYKNEGIIFMKTEKKGEPCQEKVN